MNNNYNTSAQEQVNLSKMTLTELRSEFEANRNRFASIVNAQKNLPDHHPGRDGLIKDKIEINRREEALTAEIARRESTDSAWSRFCRLLNTEL